MRTGRWGKTESETLMNAVTKEAEAAGLQPSDLCGGLAEKKSKTRDPDAPGVTAAAIRKIWHKISDAVPDRSMRSCYYHAEAKLKAQAGKSGTWSSDEKALLLRCVAWRSVA